MTPPIRVAKFPFVSKIFTPIDALSVLKILIIIGTYRSSPLGFIFAKTNP